jgi:hypothetical protein
MADMTFEQWMKFFRDNEKEARVRDKLYKGIWDEESKNYIIDKDGNLRKFYALK